MSGNFAIVTRATGEVLTGAKYNADRQLFVDYATPQGLDDYSVDLATSRVQTKPDTLATSGAGELERIRYQLAALGMVAYWDQLTGPVQTVPVALTNRTGGAVALGDAVAISTVNDDSLVLDDVQGSLGAFVVAMEAVPDGVLGRFALSGRVPNVNVQGAVTRGHYVRKSATSKALEDTGIAVGDAVRPPVGALGLALSAAAGPGAGTATILLFPGAAPGPTLVPVPPVRLLIQGTAVLGARQVQVLIEQAATIAKIWVYANVAPTGADLILDVNKNGTTIWTTQANRVKVVAGANAGSQTVFDVPSVAAGDRLSVDVDQVGSTQPGGNDLLVVIQFA